MKLIDEIYKTEAKIRKLYSDKKLLIEKRKNLLSTGKIKTTWIFKARCNSNSSQITKCKKKIDSLNINLKDLIFLHNNNIYNYLINDNLVFKTIADENFRLLSDAKVYFMNKKTSYHLLTSHAKGFIGELGDNGIIDCSVNRLSFVISDWQKGEYPKSYTGNINALGQLDLKIDETGYHFLGGKVPTRFDGVISNTGDSLYIETVASYLEFGGVQYVHKLQGRIKFINRNDEIKFFQNRQRLKSMITDFRETIKD